MSNHPTIIWKYIDPNKKDKLPTDIVLCTNNIEATYNHGQMSHVWIGKLKRKTLGKDYVDKYEVECTPFYDNFSSCGNVRHIDYYAEYIPSKFLEVDKYDSKIANLYLKHSDIGFYSLPKN